MPRFGVMQVLLRITLPLLGLHAQQSTIVVQQALK